MARTNFQYEKRQRELEKKKKADEKARRKLEAKTHPGGGAEEGRADEGSTEAGAGHEADTATPATPDSA
jgi:hypothetical protein